MVKKPTFNICSIVCYRYFSSDCRVALLSRFIAAVSEQDFPMVFMMIVDRRVLSLRCLLLGTQRAHIVCYHHTPIALPQALPMAVRCNWYTVTNTLLESIHQLSADGLLGILKILKKGKVHYILLDFMNYQHRGNVRNLNLVVAFNIEPNFKRVPLEIGDQNLAGDIYRKLKLYHPFFCGPCS